MDSDDAVVWAPDFRTSSIVRAPAIALRYETIVSYEDRLRSELVPHRSPMRRSTNAPCWRGMKAMPSTS